MQEILFYFVNCIIREGIWTACELSGHDATFTQTHLPSMLVVLGSGLVLVNGMARVPVPPGSRGNRTDGQQKDTTQGGKTSVLSQYGLKN